MIVVTVGTNEARFDRLLQVIAGLRTDEVIFVQHGPSTVRPANATCVDYMPFDSLAELVREARVVISHAGVGSVLVALNAGKHPLVMPRLARLGEAVDDHQVGFARRFEAAGLISVVEDAEGLAAAVAGTELPATSVAPAGAALADELRVYIGTTLARRTPAVTA